MERMIDQNSIEQFREYLILEEKSMSTIKKYIRDVEIFHQKYAKNRNITREEVIQYKASIVGKYRPASVNSKLASINRYFRFMGWTDCVVKPLKVQRDIFRAEEKVLSREEYRKLLQTAVKKGKLRLALVIETICASGIRVSELAYVTVEAVKRGSVTVMCKGKSRKIFLPRKLCWKLKRHIRENKVEKGSVFITKNGNPLDRSNIWSEMKALSREAGISPGKVFPHNLRHLFAAMYYSIEKDIAKLADILGHSSINTTRIYIKTSGGEHQKQLEKLGLIL